MSELRPIEAVVFDMDGVLIDSEPFWQEAEIEVFAGVGLELDRDDGRRTMGMRVDEVVGYWAERRPWRGGARSRHEMVDAILDGVVDRIRRRGVRTAGVGFALETCAERGYRTALASSSPGRVIAAVLDALDLRPEFEVAVSAEREARGKPDPAVYLSACRELGVDPGRAVAVEDSLAGLEAALRAAMRTVVVPDPSLAGRPELARAHARLDSLEKLDHGVWESLGGC